MPPNSRRLNGIPAKPFSSRLRMCDLKSAAMQRLQKKRRGVAMTSALADANDLGKADERGDAGSEDDEQQTDDDLIGGFRIVALPVADQGPAGTHVHHAQADEPDHGCDGRDDLRHIPNISE